jgi:predicted phage terminase large subunit-like protein
MKVMVCRALDENENPLWEERFSKEKLKKYKDAAGSVVFALQFQNDASLCNGSIVREENIRYYEELPCGVTLHCGVDPAISTSPEADFFAVVVVGHKKGDFYVIRAHEERLSFNKQVATIERFWNEYRPIHIAVEANAYQKVLVEVLRQRGISVRAVHQTENKEIRIMRLSAIFESGHIWLKREQTELIGQILSYPNSRYDDLLDALALAVRSAGIRKVDFHSIPGL